MILGSFLRSSKLCLFLVFLLINQFFSYVLFHSIKDQCFIFSLSDVPNFLLYHQHVHLFKILKTRCVAQFQFAPPRHPPLMKLLTRPLQPCQASSQDAARLGQARVCVSIRVRPITRGTAGTLAVNTPVYVRMPSPAAINAQRNVSDTPTLLLAATS